jgi:hypothetical protein
VAERDQHETIRFPGELMGMQNDARVKETLAG